MRLTEKYDDDSGYGVKENYAYEQHLYIDLGAYEDCIQKLGQLEDIEEELGIDLITLFKALKDGVWVKFWAGIGYYDKPFLRTDVKPYSIDFSLLSGFQHQKLTDYGKTWALTKEELEK